MFASLIARGSAAIAGRSLTRRCAHNFSVLPTAPDCDVGLFGGPHVISQNAPASQTSTASPRRFPGSLVRPVKLCRMEAGLPV